MWKNLLSKIEKVEEGRLRAPATNKELERMKQTIKDKWHDIILLDQYSEFLKVVNGLDFNGLVIYGVDSALMDKEVNAKNDGLIEMNEIWHENECQKKYVFFGDSDIAWYCYDLSAKVFRELDKPSGTEMNTYIDFPAMLEDMLETRLG